MRKLFCLVFFVLVSFLLFSQDKIVTKNGLEIKGKILEVKLYLITYKKADMPDGPVYEIPKKDVFLVEYENGKRETYDYEFISDKQRDYCLAGKKDAQKNYRGYRMPMIQTMITGIITGPVGLFPAFYYSNKPERDSNDVVATIPVNMEFETLKNPEYVTCYKKRAYSMKKKKVWTGLAIGGTINIGVSLYVLLFIANIR